MMKDIRILLLKDLSKLTNRNQRLRILKKPAEHPKFPSLKVRDQLMRMNTKTFKCLKNGTGAMLMEPTICLGIRTNIFPSTVDLAGRKALLLQLLIDSTLSLETRTQLQLHLMLKLLSTVMKVATAMVETQVASMNMLLMLEFQILPASNTLLTI